MEELRLHCGDVRMGLEEATGKERIEDGGITREKRGMRLSRDGPPIQNRERGHGTKS